MGDLFYYLDLKHRAIAYANIKSAFGDKMSPKELSRVARGFYRAFGQNFLEMFLLPDIDDKYIKKYVTIEGLENVTEARKRGKGVIFVSLHEGSWELSNAISASLGIPLVLFVRDQGFPRLNEILNSLRLKKGLKIIQKDGQGRELIEELKNHQSIGITVDQGGRAGTKVEFFGRSASMSTGAIKLAMKYDAAIVPVFYTRVKGPYIRAIASPVLQLRRSGDLKADIKDNLQRLIAILEGYLREYPTEYLWVYKAWKHTDQKNILILDDGKAGHLRQAQAASGIAKEYFVEKGMRARIDTARIEFKSQLARKAFVSGAYFSGKYGCQGCLWCLRSFLTKDTYEPLARLNPDVIISCGSSLSAVNYVLSRQNMAKSITILRPSIMGVYRFDLVIIPRHDRPPKRKNVVATAGALNLINQDYLKEQSERLTKVLSTGHRPYIGLLIGGNTKNFSLDKEMISEVIKQVKSASEALDAAILITTSRRTPLQVEELLKDEFRDYPRAKLLVIANEKNIPEAVGGILGLSQAVICTPESISMISEAVSSAKYALVFNAPGLDKRHKRFLEDFARNHYIYLTQASLLGEKIKELLRDKPEIPALRDNLKIKEAIGKIL
ncbi:MAG: ELM1/GtrOC1 family putative glycosyltransferase [Candidatus Omnitrophica bacterium]|nr:ELM1/GtrOC1 family putative glycosyltransferase [Candidatus Omnitrophota bacterium]